MNRPTLIVSKRSLVLLLSLSLAFALLLVIFWGDDSQEHTGVSTQLIELKELDARLDRDVLRITSFLLSHYDSLVQTTGRLKALNKMMTIRGKADTRLWSMRSKPIGR